MYEPSVAPVPQTAPSPPTAPSPRQFANARYVYLLGRLRERQITMEEATELFALQQELIRVAQLPPPPSGSRTVGSAAPSGSGPALGALSIPATDDLLWMTLLTMGAGSGLLAATARRAMDGRAPATPPKKRSTS